MEPSSLVCKTITSPVAAVLPLATPDEQHAYSNDLDRPDGDTVNIVPPTSTNQNDTFSSTDKPARLIQWKIAGCFGNGSRFYAYPLFAIGRPPLHIHVYIPDQTQHPPELRQQLESGATMTCSPSEVANLGISRHLQHALEVWSSQIPDFETVYLNLPFLSRIEVQDIAANVRNMQIDIVSKSEPERGPEFLPLNRLRELWRSSSHHEMNLVIDFPTLELEA